MATTFDPGICHELFVTLCEQAPDESAYPYSAFRVEWGPIFYRGRLDGTARVLCIGQDPAQNEAVVRRILIGVAGHRVQGFLAKLGIDRSYVMINTFLYSIYNQGRAAPHTKDAAVAGYRNRWFSALLASGSLEAVVSFGSLADTAWREFTKSSDVAAALPYRHVPHPTSPESAGGTPQQIEAATTAMLTNWNSALQSLRQYWPRKAGHGNQNRQTHVLSDCRRDLKQFSISGRKSVKPGDKHVLDRLGHHYLGAQVWIF